MSKGDSSTGDLVEATEKHPKGPGTRNPQQPLPKRIDLTPEEPMNIGYVGGVRVSK